MAQSATEVLDEVVQLFDQAVSARESEAAHRMREVLAERAKSGEDRQALLDAILAIVADPAIPDAVVFAGGTAATELLKALEILRELNATGARKVPANAPIGFVPTRWRGYLDTAIQSGNTSAYRHYWELCVLLALRTGDVWLPGSRRYSDPAAYLLTPSRWADHRVEFCRLVGNPPTPPRDWPRSRMSCARRCASWDSPWPKAMARCAWTPTATW